MGGGSALGSDQALSEEQLEQMKDSMVSINHIGACPIWLGFTKRNGISPNPISAQKVNELAERIRLPNFHIAQLDWNQDGYIQRNEVPEHLSRYIDFDRLDRNLDDYNPW